MHRSRASTLFAGDPGDPCAARIAEALPRTSGLVACPESLPDEWPDTVLDARTIVVHRGFLASTDIERLRRLRSRRDVTAKLVLCYGPQVRHHQIERCLSAVDAVLPDATAHQFIRRYLAEAPPRTPPREWAPAVQIVAADHEMRQVLADIARGGGYRTTTVRVPEEAQTGPILWEVPVLESGWPETLDRLTRLGPVIALVGFADRSAVEAARARGAAACLDLPSDAADVIHVLDRITARRYRPIDAPHTLPRAPAGLGHSPRPAAATAAPYNANGRSGGSAPPSA